MKYVVVQIQYLKNLVVFVACIQGRDVGGRSHLSLPTEDRFTDHATLVSGRKSKPDWLIRENEKKENLPAHRTGWYRQQLRRYHTSGNAILV